MTDWLDASILIVDDAEADARLMADMLRGSGYRAVMTTCDPRGAVELHRKHAFDLVILDVLMPGMDGFGVLARLHAAGAEMRVPVIMVTADPEFMKRALEAGAHDFISKPVRLVELRSRVRNALELSLLAKDARARGRLLAMTLHERTADLREAEGRFRALVEQSLAGIYIVEEGRFTYANPRLCEWLGYTLDELLGIPTIELVDERDRELVLENRRRREAGDHAALSATYRVKRRDGAIRHLSLSGKMIELKGRMVVLGMAEDVTERLLAAQSLRESEERYRLANRSLRSLSERMLAIQEEERRHISRELHDDVGQSLLALGIGLHRLEKFVDADHRGLLAECTAVTTAVQEKLRELSLQLHPPHLDQLGLVDALSWLVNRHKEMTGMALEFRSSGMDGARAAAAVEGACFRICQEALNNATRHARARQVTVELKRRQGRLEVSVADDGIGFDESFQREAMLASGSLGLISMEERARLAGGRLELRTGPGSGTTVTASFSEEARQTESASAGERVRTP